MITRAAAVLLAAFAAVRPAEAQTPAAGLAHAEPAVFALRGARVIIGDGSAPQDNATILVRNGRIAEVGTKVTIPRGTKVFDVTGKTVIPGLVDMHGHHYANTGRIKNMFDSYPVLYLAGGITSVLSPGDFDPEGTYDLKQKINRGEAVGARLFMGGYYIDHNPSQISWFKPINNAQEAVQRFEEWKDKIDIVKFYTSVTEEEMIAVIAAAKRAGIPTTGHLRSVNASRAIDLGINGLEHGFGSALVAIFAADSAAARRPCAMGEVDLNSPAVNALVDKIIANRVAIDPTFVVTRIGRPDFMPIPPERERFYSPTLLERQKAAAARPPQNQGNPECTAKSDAKAEGYIKKIHDRGGLILVGTDPVHPKLVPGYALHEEMKILVHAGISPLDVLKIASHNAAVALRKEKEFGTISPGKLADLVVIDGDPSVRIEDVGKTFMIFQAGVRFDPAELRKAAEGKIAEPPPATR